MASSDKIKELRSALETITQYKDNDLISRPKWGEINFEGSKEDLELVFSIATDLSDLPLKYLTDTTNQQIIDHIPDVTTHLEAIDTFSLTGDAETHRDKLSAGLHTAAEGLNTHASNPIPYLAYKRGDVSTNIAALNAAVEQAEQALEAAKKDIAKKLKELDGVISAARDAAASVGVATFTQQFDKEATTLGDRSKVWLGATAFFVAATIGAAILFYFWPKVPDNADGWQTLRNVISKAAIFAVLFTGTVWCGNIYRALMHQATINRHRALSLQTFQAFVAATDDARIKGAVLMAATRTVFGSVPTGLVDEGGANQDSGVQFVEIGKSAAKKVADAASD